VKRRLPAWGTWMTRTRADALFARWAADEAAGAPIPALCRACGQVLRFAERPHQQMHVWCEPKKES
jgi:hypothetical protein